ncbi:hypothetical protein Pyn_38683 [Prunus yedoensis var. nudiflora]|uniref:MBD domain-containing protein n=1 Tax=Prunus yedoensis var. nudiflora TaxID=2094558 RepID=A0A314YB73_PRUYE|nr:hypothetical protein Pyn_38683 [Prunus yedoensis var. nudiflora]
MKKSRWSQSNPIPLLTKRPAGEEEEEPSCHSKRELQLVTTSPFRLPMVGTLRKSAVPLAILPTPEKSTGMHFRPPSHLEPFHVIVQYYIEPGMGLKFRSLSAVQRYLTEGKIETRTKNSEPGNEWNKQIAPRTTWSTSSFILPDGWEVEEKQRNNSHIIDKTYIEPGTGLRFRSLISVERYLTGANEDTPLKALIPANKSGLSPGSGHQKMKSLDEIQSQKVVSSSLTRNISGVNDRPSKLNFGRPPAKVKWVLGGPGGCMWNPFMDESKVPDSVLQKWSETFVSSLYGGNIGATRS